MTAAAGPMTWRARCGAACRMVLRLGLVLLVAWILHRLMGWATGLALFEDDRLRLGMLAAFLVAYAILIAVPFVPGVEIGLSLIVMEGAWIAPLIYVATVAGLALAYALGEWVPYRRLHRICADLRLVRACRLIETVEPLPRAARLAALGARVPAWLRPLVSRYRYVLLGVLVNLPGNAVLGGGGGILFTAGLSRLFRAGPTLLTLMVAVAPVPLAVWLFGLDLGTWPG